MQLPIAGLVPAYVIIFANFSIYLCVAMVGIVIRQRRQQGASGGYLANLETIRWALQWVGAELLPFVALATVVLTVDSIARRDWLAAGTYAAACALCLIDYIRRDDDRWRRRGARIVAVVRRVGAKLVVAAAHH